MDKLAHNKRNWSRSCV